MNDLTLGFERETGQVIGAGLPAGAAGEAFLALSPGLDLAFDRADGRLCRAVVQAVAADGSVTIDKQVAVILTKLFGPSAPALVRDAATSLGHGPQVLSPEPGLADTLSSRARLDAVRVTSPVPAGSPGWAAEAAELAARAGLPGLTSLAPGPQPAGSPRPWSGPSPPRRKAFIATGRAGPRCSGCWIPVRYRRGSSSPGCRLAPTSPSGAKAG